MNLRFLETFVWAARLRSFRAAAVKLHLTQAAISGRIARLEEEFGQRLFDRGCRDLQLTPAGCLLLTHAEHLLEEEHAMHAALTGAQALRGHVRLGMIESIVYTWMEPFLRRVNSQHPALELELTVDPTARLHELLLRGVADIILQTDPVLGDDVRNLALGQLEMAWIAPAGGLLPRRPSMAEMAASPVVTFTRGSQPHKAVLAAFESAQVRPARVHCITSIAAITRLVCACDGVASLPLAAVREQLDAGVFRIVDCERPLPPLKVVASYRNDPARGLAEALATLAAEEMRRFVGKK